MRVNIIIQVLFFVLLIPALSGCDNNGNAQQNATAFDLAFSGSFVPAPASTDTNGDGRPASLRAYGGQSDFGNTVITILDEFAQPVPPVSCPPDTLEFDLVQGSFVIRVGNGDLLLGVIESGKSCFDPVAGRSEISEEGSFTGGTGQFEGAAGPVELKTSSIFLNTTAVNGFASGGSTGEVTGTIEPE